MNILDILSSPLNTKNNIRISIIFIISLMANSVFLVGCSKEQEFEKLKNEVNSKLEYSSLETENTIYVEKDPRNKKERLVASYHVSINKDKEKRIGQAYPFKIGKYTFESDEVTSDNGICQMIASIDKANKKSVLEIIRDAKPNLTVGTGTVMLKVELSEAFKILAQGKPSRIDILIKGGADDSPNDWSQALDPNYKNFGKTIEVYPAKRPKSYNPTVYIPKSETVTISSGGKYKNQHLANLRAKFVADDIIQQGVMEGCMPFFDSSIGSKISSHILNGYTGQKVDPKLRKAEVYLQIYVNED